jgi:hypothetical protein
MPRIMLINQRIAGDPRHPNAQSSFVDSTSVMLSTLTTILFSKYFSALSDHLGRRPILALSTLFSIVSSALWLQSTSSTGFFLASLAGGLANIFFFVGLAWLCDHSINQIQRGKAIALYVGTVIGLTLSIGLPPSPPPRHSLTDFSSGSHRRWLRFQRQNESCFQNCSTLELPCPPLALLRPNQRYTQPHPKICSFPLLGPPSSLLLCPQPDCHSNL